MATINIPVLDQVDHLPPRLGVEVSVIVPAFSEVSNVELVVEAVSTAMGMTR